MKNKRFFIATLTLAMFLSTLPTFGLINSASAEQPLSSVDEYFLDFVEDDIFGKKIEYSSSPLYDETLNQTGYEYTFEVDGQIGYALIEQVQVGENSYYEVEELSYTTRSPFAERNGLPVYITFNLYLDYVNETLYDLLTGEPVSEQTLARATQTRFGYFGGGTDYTTQTYTITYDHKTEETYVIQYGLPTYGPTEGTSCANAAGINVIGYYDRFYPNLVPNETTYIMLGTNFMYKGMSVSIGNICVQLSNLMGTTSSGTTFSGFNAGMAIYVQQQGYSYSSSSVFTNGNFDFNKYKTAVQNGKPVSLFLTSYAFYMGTTTANNVDTIESDICAYTHVAVGCGYKAVTYYDANNNVISTQMYLRVSTGLALYPGLCYLNASAYTTINNAIAITIQ